MKLPFIDHARSGAGLPPLPLPEPDPACNPNTRARPAELKRWLNDLPHANPVQVCRELQGQLRLLVRYPEPIGRFGQLIELVEPIAAEIVRTMLRAPAASFGQATLEQVMERDLHPMLVEYANANKRAINEQLAQGKDPGTRLLFGCATAMSLVILIESLTYRGLSPQSWREMLQLKQMADTLGHATDSADVEEGLHGAQSVHELFFGTLLSQLADPLGQSAQQTWDLFATAVGYAHLVDFDGAAGTDWCVGVDVTGRAAPLDSMRRGSESGGRSTRWLNLAPLVVALNEADESPEVRLLLDTVQRMAGIAGIGEERRHPRYDATGRYQCYTGLVQVHARLGALSASSRDDAADDQAPHRPAVTPTPLPCGQVNQSQSGAAFLFNAGQRNYPRVNDLVLLEGTNEQGRLTGFAAVVRRMLRNPDDSVEIGVERLAGNFTPMTVLDPPDNIKGRELPVALIRHSPQLDGLELLAPTGIHGARTTLNLSGPSSKHKVHLNDLQGRLHGIEQIAIVRDD